MKIYCITDLDSPPHELLSDNDDKQQYKHHILGPPPTQVVVFTTGSWAGHFVADGKIRVEAHADDCNSISLGNLAINRRCMVWEGKWPEPSCSSRTGVMLILKVEGEVKTEKLLPQNEDIGIKLLRKKDVTPKSERTIKMTEGSTLANEVTPTSSERGTKTARKGKGGKGESLFKTDKTPKDLTLKTDLTQEKESTGITDISSPIICGKVENCNSLNNSISKNKTPCMDGKKKQTIKSDKKENTKRRESKSDKTNVSEMLDQNVESKVLFTKDSNKIESTPAEVIFKPVKSGERKKRARMGGVDKTPEVATPNKRKSPAICTRNIKDMFREKEKENSEKLGIAFLNSPAAENDVDRNLEEKMDVDGPELGTKDDNEKQVIIATNTANINSLGGTGPSARWGHSLCMISESEAVTIGGQGDKQQLSKDSIWLLDIEKRAWKSPGTTVSQGHKPEARMGHTAVYDPTVRSIYVFGGSKNKRWFNDVHVLDVDEWKWQLVKANGKNPTRAYHTATLYRHELWIFGGVYPQPDPKPDGNSNDIHVFSPMEESWYMPIVMGEKPIARSGHSATLLQDKLVVFGGWDYPVVYGDLDVLDLGIVEWSKPKANGAPPKARSWHASCALSGNRVLIHGGYDGNVALNDSFILNLDTLTWTCIVMEPALPPRTGHTSLCLPYKPENKNKDEILLFGGGDNDGAFFDDLIVMLVPIERSKYGL